MRRAVATRLRTRRLLVKSAFPPLIFFSGQSPSHDAKAEAFRNRETSVGSRILIPHERLVRLATTAQVKSVV
jgi:hypothetical protein